MAIMHGRATNDNAATTDAERAAHAAFARVVAERVGTEASFAEVEAAGLAFGNELCRENQRLDLERRAARWTSAELMIDGIRYRRHAPGSAMVHGLCGSFRIERPTFREVGVRNGAIAVPLDLDAGLLCGATPALAFKLCEGYAQSPSRPQHKALKSSHRVPPSRSTTERIAKKLGGQLDEAVARLEPVVRAAEPLPTGVHGLALGLDRTSAPMEERLDAEGLAKHRSERTKPYVRRAPDPIEVNYRMAYVGTVSLVDSDGRALLTRRYGASAGTGPAAIVERMMADVVDALTKKPDLRVVLVQDGAPEMWNRMCAAMTKHIGPRDVRWSEAVDRHHVVERLSDVLLLVKKLPDFRTKLLAKWSKSLDEDDDAIDVIECYVTALRDGHRGKVRVALDEHVTYLHNNKHRMRYATLRSTGLPVGSGPTEGACKSLVMVRAKGCGQRWHVEGLDAVLTLRGLDMSERLPAVFDLFAREKIASIRIAA